MAEDRASSRRCARARPARPRRRRHRRRLDDRRHGLRGRSTTSATPAAAPSSSSTTTAARTPPPSSRLTESLARLRLNPSYLRRRPGSRSMRPRGARWSASTSTRGLDGHQGRPSARCGSRPIFFETLGVRYIGPVRRPRHRRPRGGAAQRRRARRRPRRRPRAHPEGQGLRPGRERPHQAHARHRRREGPGSATPRRSPRPSSRRPRSAPELVAITAAMPDSTGLLPFEERFPDRCVDVGIAEQHAVTVGRRHGHGRPAPGVAPSTRPSSAGPSTRLNLDVGLHGQPVVFCLDRAGITGDDGPSHHGVLDMVLLLQGARHDDVRPVVVPGAAA